MANEWTYALVIEDEVHEITGSEVVVGRSRTCGLRIPEPSVSRRHFRLLVGKGTLTLQDLGSSNGTFVNDQTVRDRAPLADGDLIRAGDIVMTVRLRREGSDEDTVDERGRSAETVLLSHDFLEGAVERAGRQATPEKTEGALETARIDLEALQAADRSGRPSDELPLPPMAGRFFTRREHGGDAKSAAPAAGGTAATEQEAPEARRAELGGDRHSDGEGDSSGHADVALEILDDPWADEPAALTEPGPTASAMDDHEAAVLFADEDEAETDPPETGPAGAGDVPAEPVLEPRGDSTGEQPAPLLPTLEEPAEIVFALDDPGEVDHGRPDVEPGRQDGALSTTTPATDADAPEDLVAADEPPGEDDDDLVGPLTGPDSETEAWPTALDEPPPLDEPTREETEAPPAWSGAPSADEPEDARESGDRAAPTGLETPTDVGGEPDREDRGAHDEPRHADAPFPEPDRPAAVHRPAPPLDLPFDVTPTFGTSFPPAVQAAAAEAPPAVDDAEVAPPRPRRYGPPPPAAGFGARLAAALIEAAWIAAVWLGTVFLLDVVGDPRASQVIAAVVLGAAVVVILLGWTVWGTTPGKRALGLYVCTVDGTPGIGPLRALVRLGGYLVSALPLGIGFLSAMFGDRRTLHDRLSGTYVARLG